MAAEVVDDLRDDGTVTRGWLGVQIQPVTNDIAESLGVESTDGAIVADAMADGPAVGAGIQAGDIITKVNGESVKDPKTLSETIARIEPGQEITITIMRDGREQEIKVTLGNLNDFDASQQATVEEPAAPEATTPTSLEALGLTVEDNPDGSGLRVTDVAADSPAADKGLSAGDVIVAVGGQSVETASDIEDGINAAQDNGRDAVLFRVQGENGTRFVGVPFERS
jgi:serine protease Do